MSHIYIDRVYSVQDIADHQSLYNHLSNIYNNESEQFFHSQFSFAERYRAYHHDRLPDNTFWNYLEVRRGLDVVRFDRYHEVVGKWIAEVPVVTVAYPGPPVGHETAEPSSLVMWAIVVIAAAVYVIVRNELAKRWIW